MRNELTSGPRHYAWKGDAATETTKRERIQRLLSLEGVTCEHDGCKKPAVDRHHVDGDTGNNDLSNIRCLCRLHHMEEDGRLAAFIAAGQHKLHPPKPCIICEQPRKPLRKGRCGACNEYLRRNGVDRPPEVIYRYLTKGATTDA